MQYFVDYNGSIRFYDETGRTDYPGEIIVNEKQMIVYSVDEFEMVTGEYTLWPSLTELAKHLEQILV